MSVFEIPLYKENTLLCSQSALLKNMFCYLIITASFLDFCYYIREFVTIISRIVY